MVYRNKQEYYCDKSRHFILQANDWLLSQNCPSMCLGFYFILYKPFCLLPCSSKLRSNISPNEWGFHWNWSPPLHQNLTKFWSLKLNVSSTGEVIFFSKNFASYLAWHYSVSVFNLSYFSMKKNAIFLSFYFMHRNWDWGLGWEEYRKNPNLLHTLKRAIWGNVRWPTSAILAFFMVTEGNEKQIATPATDDL